MMNTGEGTMGGYDLIRHGCAVPPTTGLTGPVSLETAHSAVSRALDAPQGEGKGKPLPGEQVEVVEAEIDRQRIQRALLRVAVGNTNTAEDYANMTTKARGDYAVDARRPGPLRRLGAFLLGAYALIVLGLVAAYRAQDRVLMATAGASGDGAGGTTSSVWPAASHLPLKGKAMGRR